MESSKKVEIDLHGLVLVVVAASWLAGIVLGDWINLPVWISLIGALASLICVILFWRSDRGLLLALITLWLMLGAWRYAIVSPVGDPQAISTFIGQKKLEVQGTVADEPTLEARSRLLTVAVSSVSTDSGSSWQDAHGQIDVMMLGSYIDNPYGPNYGDAVELKGKLDPPSPHSPPEIFASMAFPALTVNASGGNPIIAALFQLRTQFAIIIERSLPPPLAALLIAILLSLRTPALIPLIPYFNETGTAHLIAPSGFKVTILAGLVSASARWLYYKEHDKQTRLLPAQKRRDWRRWLATMLVGLNIAVYTVLSGAGPAAIRAGIMGILLVIAPRIGRIYNFYTAIALAAFLMSMVDPFILWDAGFQLSFLGTLGIVMLTPFFLRFFRSLERFPFGHIVAEISAVTLAAQCATWPIIAITFSQVSFIAPLANLLSVPLLGILIPPGFLICASGFFSTQISILFGWIIQPLLLFLSKIIPWLASTPGAFLSVNNTVSAPVAWGYYVLLSLVVIILFRLWPETMQTRTANKAPPLFSYRTWRILQISAALIIVLATGISVHAAHPGGRLMITFLHVGPAGQPAQGESILIQTPDGKTVLIDGGMDAVSLSQQLYNTLPLWQRSLDAVILTAPREDHLAGLQDVVTRYQIEEVIDAGMLHPNVSYALWRRSISDRGLSYMQARQHITISIGSQVLLQVLWPPSPLHKSSDEELDNSLVMRLVAPGFQMLLLGVAALSKYALNGLASTLDPSLLQANVVQVVGEAGKSFPASLSSILQMAHPSLLVITPAMLSAKSRKAGQSSVITPAPFAGATWRVIQTAQLDHVEISSSGNEWNLS
ncbi:MAG TPA: ComEC/Rec2 family competence protein [Ktedonobacteraceae bacterium]|nr:ComEC/Rec2 family competence protein [Ktedonobacteraceae bacterium]